MTTPGDPDPGPLDPLRLGLMGVDLTPIYEFAEGQKVDLERRGWSPTAAETAALTILVEALRLAFARC